MSDARVKTAAMYKYARLKSISIILADDLAAHHSIDFEIA